MPVIVTPDFLINQLNRDSIVIAASFDELCAEDVKEVSQLLAESAAILLGALSDRGRKPKELQVWSCEVLINVSNSITAAVYVLRAGYRLVPGVVLRNAVEAMAVCLHGLQVPNDLSRIKSGDFNSPKAINTSKRVIPHFGELYGFLSNQFAHAGPLHHSMQPLIPYESREEGLIVNLRAVRAAAWFHYVVSEFAFMDVVEKPRYWHRVTSTQAMFNPSEAERQWQKRFLLGPELAKSWK